MCHDVNQNEQIRGVFHELYKWSILSCYTYVRVSQGTNIGTARKGIQVYTFHNFQLLEWYNSSLLHQQNFQSWWSSYIQTVKLVWTFQYILSHHGYMSSILDLLSIHNRVEHKRATSNHLSYLSWHPRHLCFVSQACHITRQYQGLQNHPMTKMFTHWIIELRYLNVIYNKFIQVYQTT